MKRYDPYEDATQQGLDALAELIVAGLCGVLLFGLFGYLVFFA